MYSITLYIYIYIYIYIYVSSFRVKKSFELTFQEVSVLLSQLCVLRIFIFIYLFLCATTAGNARNTKRLPRNALCDACFRCGLRVLQKRLI